MMFGNRMQPRSWLALSAVVLAGTLALAACDDDDSTGPDAEEWAAELEGVGDFADVTGEAVVLAQPTKFTAEITLADATPDDVYSWRVASGTCAQPGALVGAQNNYPNLTIDDDGAASAEASVTAALSASGSYIVSVRNSADTTQVVACGALTRD